MKKVLVPSMGALAIALTLSLIAPCAHADLELQYSIDGGALQTLVTGASGSTQNFCDDGSVGCGPTLGGIFAVDGQIKSNSPGSPTLAKLLDSTLDIENVSGATHTIEFFAIDTGFTAPAAPPNPGVVIQSSVGGSVTTASADNALSLTSCVDAGNDQDACHSGSITVGPGTPDTTKKGSFSDDEFLTTAALGTPYSVSQEVTVTLGASSEINFADTTNLTPTPEPFSAALLGGLLVGTATILKRRKKLV
jgi:hypothetical protein